MYRLWFAFTSCHYDVVYCIPERSKVKLVYVKLYLYVTQYWFYIHPWFMYFMSSSHYSKATTLSSSTVIIIEWVAVNTSSRRNWTCCVHGKVQWVGKLFGEYNTRNVKRSACIFQHGNKLSFNLFIKTKIPSSLYYVNIP